MHTLAGPRALWRALLTPPAFAEPQRTYRAQILHAILLTVFATTALVMAVGVPFVFVRKLAAAALFSATVVAASYSWHLMRRGAIRAASHVLAWSLWTVTSMMLLFAEAPNVGLYVPIVLITMVLLGPRWALAAGFAGFAVAAIAVFSAQFGIGLPHYFPSPPAARLFLFVIQTLLSVVPFFIVGRGLDLTLERLNSELKERSTAQNKLQQSESRLSLALDAACTGIWEWSPGTGAFTGTPHAHAIFGVAPGDFGGTYADYLRLVHPDDAERVAQFNQRVLAGGMQGLALDYRLIRPDGAARWVEGRGTLQPGEDGNPTRVIGTIVDITERKATELLLERERKLLRTLVDNLPDDVFIIDADGCYTMVNAAWLAKLGTGETALPPGRTVFDYFEHDIAARFDRENQRIMATGVGLYNQRRTMHSAHGGTRWVLTSKIPLRDAEGKSAGIIGINRDVTELHDALDRLQDERNLLRSIIDAVPDAILVKDRECRYVIMNREALSLRGAATIEEIAGRRARDFLPAERAAQIEAEDRRVMDSGEPSINVTRRSAFPGTARHWVSTSKVPLRSGDGALYGIVEINRDVSALQSIIEEVNKLNAELEDRVRERTEELQKANNELESFSYSVSHDLRAPLRSIMGFGNFLLKDNHAQLDAAGRARLDRILAASARMGELIDDLLTLGRISRQSMDKRNVDLSGIAREIAKRLADEDPQRAVTFEIADALALYGDEGLIRIVLENLLGNAWKFTGRLAAATIAFGETDVHGTRSFFVRDNGAGFDMKYASKLFTPFQRLHSQHQFEGTGIGLATVKRIIERHHGEIRIESAVDAGTTVFFTVGAV